MRGQVEHIFNADAEFVRQIDARLHRGHIAGLVHIPAAGRGAITLVYFQPHAVPQGVAEILRLILRCQYIVGRLVHLFAGHAGVQRLNTCQLRAEHQVISRLHFCRGAAHGHCASHIRMVAPVGGAKVKQHKVALLHFPILRHTVGHGGMGAG